MSPKFIVMLLYEFDMWFRYDIPEVDATDIGFVELDYSYYGLSGIV